MASPAKLRRIARSVASRQGLNPTLFEKQIAAESDFRNLGPNQANAAGVAQLTPGIVPKGVDRMEPRSALKLAAKIMADYVKKYGNTRDALVAYNAGPGRVGKPLYAETRAYIDRITGGGAGQTGLGAKHSGGGGSPSTNQTSRLVADPGTPSTAQVSNQTSFDQAAFDKAQRASQIGQFLASRHGTSSILFKSGLLSTQAPNPASYTNTQQVVTTTPGQPATLTSDKSAGGADAAPAGKGLDAAFSKMDLVDKVAPHYKWGGGHGGVVKSKADIRAGLDCSGAVSYALGLKTPLVSGDLARVGNAGAGKVVTIFANATHTFLRVKDPRTGKVRYWGTSGQWRPNGGAGWFSGTPGAGYLANFTQRHLPGM